MSKDSFLAHVPSELPKKQVEALWSEFQKAIVAELKAGEEVTLQGVGKLKPTVRPARTARNPQTGESMDVPEKQTVKLSVSKVFAN